MENETGPPDAHSLKALKYLTVQDILWINLQVTKKVQHFNFAKLEEATFYQYGYGGSRDLGRQAARFISGFLKLRPLTAGSDATAFVACVAFLLLNGKSMYLADEGGAEWVERIRTGKANAGEELSAMLVENDSAHDPIASDVRDAVLEVLKRFPATVEALGASQEKLAS